MESNKVDLQRSSSNIHRFKYVVYGAVKIQIALIKRFKIYQRMWRFMESQVCLLFLTKLPICV